jgi:peptide/nickel transport system permease protein
MWLLSTIMSTQTAEVSRLAILQRSPRQIAWHRLKRNKVSMISAYIAIFFLILAFGAPIFTAIFHVNNTNVYPNALSASGMPIGPWGGVSWKHPFGLEPGVGRDLFGLLVYGSRISFSVAIITSISFVVVGLFLGISAGLIGGVLDNVIGRICDFLLAFPTIFMFVALSVPLTLRVEATGIAHNNGARIVVMVLILVVFSWPGFFRVVRSQVLSIREKEFILAARVAGASNIRIIFKEILPNLWPLAIIYLSISLPGYLAAEAVFSFLGVGVQAPGSTWGLVLNDASNFWQRDPAYLGIPAGMVIIVVLTLNLFGDGLRDALDSKSDR